MKWMLVGDSSCDLREMKELAPETEFSTVPLKIRVGPREFVDNAQLDIAVMMEMMGNFNGGSTTACPSPEEWAEKFVQADYVLAVTISSQLSGSYNSALVARDMVLEEHPDKNICVIDSRTAGGELALILWEANRAIAEGCNFTQVSIRAQTCADERQTLFALACFDNLVKNGRLSKMAGFVAGKLNMRAVGRGSEEGKLELLHKTRGETRMLALMLEEMDKRGYQGARPVIISHCFNEEAAHLLARGIKAKWPGSEAVIVPTCGLTSFYAEKQGLILGY